MLLTFQGYFDGGEFFPDEPTAIPNLKKTIVTVLDEDVERKNSVAARVAAFERITKMLDEAGDEDDLPDPLPRFNIERKLNL
jgi:hypothetical protein